MASMTSIGSAAEQSKLTVTAFNTTAGEHAATSPQTITVTNTPNDLSYLMQLLNELQPAFPGGHLRRVARQARPSISIETIGKDHVVDAFRRSACQRQ